MTDFEPAKYARPLRLAIILVLAALCAIVGWLQLSSGQGMEQLQEAQLRRTVYVPSCRGRLLDCDGNLLDYSVPVYSIAINPSMTRDPRDTRNRSLEKLSAAISVLATALGPDFYQAMPSQDALRRHITNQPAMPIVLWEDIDEVTRARWLALKERHPATELQLSWRREYAFPTLARQWRGLVGKRIVGEDDNGRYWNANAFELYGTTGMEAALEELLGGQGGAQLLRTDALSYRTQTTELRPADNGDDCRMTMASAPQAAAEAALDATGLPGAAVALDLRDGAVMVLASATPGLQRGSTAEATALNRAISGHYPPGSVMKPLVAIYALSHGIAQAETPVIRCPGYIMLSESHRMGCSHVHGDIAMQAAIAQSCNTYFATIGQRLEPEEWDKFARLFGFGVLPGGHAGLKDNAGIPFCPSWVKEHRDSCRAWLTSDAATASIGQGGWAVTPIQMALASALVVTGKLYEPRFHDNDAVRVRTCHDWPAEARKVVLGGMRDCVLSGTGRALAIPGVQVFGKTGTAEVGGGRRPHAWVTAAAPFDAPRYLVTVVVENGGGGGKTAAPIAREILRALLERD